MSDVSITPFLFEGEALVRVVSRQDAPWFVAADLCRVLGLTNPTKAIEGLDEDEVALITLTNAEGNRGNPMVNIISESGMYAMIFRSRKAAAHRFRKWVTSEVLPAIRKTGAYHAKPLEGEVIPPDGDKRAFPDWTMDEMRTRRGVVDMYRMTYGIQAAQWIMPQMGFPQPPQQFIERGRQMVIQFPEAAE
jgi:hypothetical protein